MKTTLPLKFRCWHTVHKQMYNVVEIHNSMPTIISQPSVIKNSPMMIMVGEQELEYLIVMVASPYQDKDGNWIYEGDFVAPTDGPQTDNAGEVLFENGCFFVLLDSEDGESEEVPLFILAQYNLEVVEVKYAS